MAETDTETDTAAQHAVDLLAGQLASDAVVVGPEAVSRAVRPWNRRVAGRPAMLARCRSAQDVQAAVRAATGAGLPVSVLGGGHGWAGNALRDDAMVLDLRGMRQVVVGPQRTAVAGGGATSSDILDAAGRRGLGAALGTVGSVGAAGLILGGGLSPLVGVAGLGVDTLLRAEIVLADGRIVTADADSEPFLFWALRGGGGNFGVVTELELALLPVAEVTAGMIAFPWSQAADVLRGWRALTASADDALDVMFGAVNGPDGPMLFTSPMWAGEAAAAEEHIASVRALGVPVIDQVARVPLADTVHALDAEYPHGGCYRLSSRTLPAPVSDRALAAFLAAAEAMPGRCALNVHHIHGAATRVPVSGTAYPYRQEHLVVEILGCWSDGDGDAEQAWVADTERRLDPLALPGGWTNLMAPGDPRARDAYGPNTARLLAVKRHYDPTGVFDATPLPHRH